MTYATWCDRPGERDGTRLARGPVASSTTRPHRQMPQRSPAASGVTAVAHCVEALFYPDIHRAYADLGPRGVCCGSLRQVVAENDRPGLAGRTRSPGEAWPEASTRRRAGPCCTCSATDGGAPKCSYGACQACYCRWCCARTPHGRPAPRRAQRGRARSSGRAGAGRVPPVAACAIDEPGIRAGLTAAQSGGSSHPAIAARSRPAGALSAVSDKLDRPAADAETPVGAARARTGSAPWDNGQQANVLLVERRPLRLGSSRRLCRRGVARPGSQRSAGAVPHHTGLHLTQDMERFRAHRRGATGSRRVWPALPGQRLHFQGSPPGGQLTRTGFRTCPPVRLLLQDSTERLRAGPARAPDTPSNRWYRVRHGASVSDRARGQGGVGDSGHAAPGVGARGRRRSGTRPYDWVVGCDGFQEP